METPVWMDAVLGGVAIAVLLGGLFLLFSGVGSMNKK
jgi:hypothetical protein